MRWINRRSGVAVGFALVLSALVGCSGAKEPERDPPSGSKEPERNSPSPAGSGEASVVDPALRQLLGKQEDSKEVAAFREQLGPPSMKASDPERYIIYAWATKGVHLHFYAKGKLKSIELRSQLYSGEDQQWADYEGALPGKLGWGDKRADVHKKLGKPEAPYFEPPAGFSQRPAVLYDAYPSLGVTVGYDKPKSVSDTDCRILYIRIEEPQTK